MADLLKRMSADDLVAQLLTVENLYAAVFR
jgi:hypothetical protein